MELFYKEYGAGFPLIILHGLLGASGNWHTLSQNHFSRHFRVFTLDQRNHGRSPHSERFDYEVMARDVRDFMDQHGLERAHLLGHSMGGKTAMHAALDFPERIEQLVVVDIAPKAYPPQHQRVFAGLRAIDPSQYDDRAEIDEVLARYVPERPVRQFLLKNLDYDGERYYWKMNLEAIHDGYDAIAAGLDDERTFDGASLFIRGGKSDYVQASDLARIQKNFPQAQLETIEEAGHWVHADRPEPFAESVMGFLQPRLVAQ